VTDDDHIDRLLGELPGDWTEALVWFLPDDPAGGEPARIALAALAADDAPATPAGGEPYVPLLLRRDPDGAEERDREALRAALDALAAQGHGGRLTRAALQRRREVMA
jgi:hypothetical protein